MVQLLISRGLAFRHSHQITRRLQYLRRIHNNRHQPTLHPRMFRLHTTKAGSTVINSQDRVQIINLNPIAGVVVIVATEAEAVLGVEEEVGSKMSVSAILAGLGEEEEEVGEDSRIGLEVV